jgi:hypothetical protein
LRDIQLSWARVGEATGTSTPTTSNRAKKLDNKRANKRAKNRAMCPDMNIPCLSRRGDRWLC